MNQDIGIYGKHFIKCIAISYTNMSGYIVYTAAILNIYGVALLEHGIVYNSQV